MRWFLEAMKKYGVFHGRARRKEFWYFLLINNALLMAVLLLMSPFSVEIAEFIFLLLVAVTFLPFLAVHVRRLHDIGLPGWLFFIYFFIFSLLSGLVSISLETGYPPLSGPLFFLFVYKVLYFILLTGKSHPGTNRYGADPLLQDEGSTEASAMVR